jgi:hypothetical protein
VYQSLGWNAGVESVSPFSSTLPDDCSDHPSRRESVASEWVWPGFASWEKIRPEKDSSATHNSVLRFIKQSFAESLFEGHSIMTHSMFGFHVTTGHEKNPLQLNNTFY